MKPRFNRLIWFGFLIVVASVASYIPIFAVFASTRDVPWVNYALFLVGGALLAVGLQRAFRDQEHYRGKVSGAILGSLSVLIAGLFVAFILYGGRQIPASESAYARGSLLHNLLWKIPQADWCHRPSFSRTIVHSF